MAATITREVLESHLKCRYKGHLKLAGERGSLSDYELVRAEVREQVREAATEKLLEVRHDLVRLLAAAADELAYEVIGVVARDASSLGGVVDRLLNALAGQYHQIERQEQQAPLLNGLFDFGGLVLLVGSAILGALAIIFAPRVSR